MMQLILWRHADAEDEVASDLARRLTIKGGQQAQHMAIWLKAQLGKELGSWRVIASPAVRAQQTAAALGLPVVTIAEIAPDASADAVIAAAAWPTAGQNTIVVGHQPTLGMVAARLINGAEGYVSVKKGAMWWFEMRERDGEQQTVLKAMATPDSVA